MPAAAQPPGNSSEYEFVEIDEIILSGGSDAKLPINGLKIPVAVKLFIYAICG
jgi:hypothetical protein